MKNWLKLTTIKVIKTMAETAIGIIGGQQLFSGIDWRIVGSATLLSAIVTILFALKNLPDDGDFRKVTFHDDMATDIREDIEPTEKEGVKHE